VRPLLKPPRHWPGTLDFPVGGFATRREVCRLEPM